MRVPFNEAKATQAASRFLRLAGGILNYMLLIKLLYLTDREAILRWGRPVTFDEYFSMHKGPILSRVLDLITEEPEPNFQRYWDKFISAPSNWKVSLVDDPGTGQLSEAEDELIGEIFEQNKQYVNNPFDLVRILHGKLPEWDKDIPEGKRSPIQIVDILRAGEKSTEEISAIHGELKSLNRIRNFVAR
jgi:antitoxin SocA-like protein